MGFECDFCTVILLTWHSGAESISGAVMYFVNHTNRRQIISKTNLVVVSVHILVHLFDKVLHNQEFSCREVDCEQTMCAYTEQASAFSSLLRFF